MLIRLFDLIEPFPSQSGTIVVFFFMIQMAHTKLKEQGFLDMVHVINVHWYTQKVIGVLEYVLGDSSPVMQNNNDLILD